MTTSDESPRIVICGGGAIGSSIAYFLLSEQHIGIPQEGGIKKPASVTLLERCEIACAASGKAGGFLASDWCNRSALGPLTRKSFQLHAQLAEELTTYSYRRLDTLALSASERRPKTHKKPNDKQIPEWVDGTVVSAVSGIGSTSTTAQVHPAQFTRTLVEEAKKKGATVRIGCCATGLQLSSDNTTVTGVRLSDGEILSADVVVIAMGPWSSQAAGWAPPLRFLAGLSGLKAHSITMKPKEQVTPHALFLDYETEIGERLDPEVYPRPDGEVYMCGFSKSASLPEDPSQVKPKEGMCARLKAIGSSISSKLAEVEVEKEQACFLPCTPDGVPMIGKVEGLGGLYVATGHSCWGILNAPVTGLLISQLILNAPLACDVSPFNPSRFSFDT